MKGYLDVTQTEHWFATLFGLETKPPLINETRRQFFLKAPLLILGIVLFGFLLLERMPSLPGAVLLLFFYYLAVFVLLKYLSFVNKISGSRSFLGLLLCILPLVLLILIL